MFTKFTLVYVPIYSPFFTPLSLLLEQKKGGYYGYVHIKAGMNVKAPKDFWNGKVFGGFY